MDERLQNQRFEFKYRLGKAKAREVRHFVSRYLECDKYGADQPDFSYPVHSLYLDSPALKTYNDTINGNRNRFKLLVRYYDNSEDKPVYLEIKRRYNKVIQKKRAIVHRKYLEDLIAGQMPTWKHLVSKTDEQLHTLERFCYLLNQINGRPKVHVRYNREAYEHLGSNSVRITFDRQVRTEKVSHACPGTSMENPTTVFGNVVILEIKFTNRYPDWLQEMTQRYHLWRESAAKYVDGILRIKGYIVLTRS